MTTKPKRQKSALAVPQPDPDGFAEIVALIATSQQDAYRAVNVSGRATHLFSGEGM